MKTITGVPETVTHEQVVTAVEALGFDPKVVRRITFGVTYVEVVVFATTPVTIKDDDAATHTIFYDTLTKPPVDD